MNKGKKLPLSINLYNPPLEFKAGSDFLISYPWEYLDELWTKRNEIWEKIDFEDIKQKWLLVVKEKNMYHNKNFQSRVEMYCDLYGISKTEYKKFVDNVDKAIEYINQKVTLDKEMFMEKESNNYCFICQANFFQVINTKEMFDFLAQKYSSLRKNKEKVRILLAEDDSKMSYDKKEDSFIITLDGRLSERHQVMDLIHEIGHVVGMLHGFESSKLKKGKYKNEKAATWFELNFLEKYFPEMFLAKLGNILQSIQISLFEMAIYDNPNQNPDKLSADCFNRCFIGAKQIKNRGYLLKRQVIYSSFEELPYSIAYVNNLTSFTK